MIRGARLCCAVIITVALLRTAPSADHLQAALREATAIDAGAPVERQVAIGEQHLYRITLTAGECAEVIVEQRGIDVIVQVSREGDTDHVEFQEEVRRSGQERVEVVAGEGAAYVIAVAASPGIYSGTYMIRVAGRRPATAADRSMFDARRLRTTALALATAARFNEARPPLERAISISEAVRGPDDMFTGMLLHDLAGIGLETRDDRTAEPHQRRALAIFDKAVGDGHPYAAMARLRIAVLLHNAGDRGQAEAALRPATQLIERTLGTEHAWFATCLRAQGSFRYGARDLDAAEAAYRRAMAILEKVGATETTAYTAVLNNLGLVYADKQDLPRAEEHYQRALAVAQRLQGTESHHISLYLQNLGIVARGRKEYAKAFEYTRRALAIRQRMLGEEHVDNAPILNNLAVLYRATGDVAAAIETFRRSLHIWERSAGPYDRGTLTAVGNIALLYADIGEVDKAVLLQRRADAILEKQIQLHVAVGSERQKLIFAKSASERTDRTISLHLRTAPGSADAAALAALVVLQRKGRVLDAMTDAFAAVRRRMDDRGRALLDRLSSTTARLARIALTTASEASAGERTRSIGELEGEKERIEEELGAYSSDMRARMQPVTLEAVQAALPERAALLEFVIFRPFDPKAQSHADAYGPPHYAGYVVRKNAPPRGLDLGPAAPIDHAVEALRQAVRDRTRTDVTAHARAVDDLLMRPLRAAYGGATQLLVSPDGALNLVPFEALSDEQGRYLIERFSISYLASGRDLLRSQVSPARLGPPVIVADPRYGEPAPARAGARRREPRPLPPAHYRSLTNAADPAALYFAPLANTAAEARAIKRLFPDALLLTGPRATKAAVARLEAPRMLHIASHGFFLEDGAGPNDAGATIENPLLRSGIALAGANLGHRPGGDGILTALEASGLNLSSTKLVTLSACDTGVGEVRNGEGVYGLRRAFALAGAETLVMSLWPLSDYIARETMVTYYAGLRSGLGRGEALRQAKLAMIRRKVRQHPYYWASFIQSGEWVGLDGKR